MRQILFRGKAAVDTIIPELCEQKQIKKGEIVTGFYAKDAFSYIYDNWMDNLARVEVDPKTVAQFICKVRNNSIYEFSRVKVDNSAISDKPIQSWGTVQWCDDLTIGYPGYIIVLDDGSIFKEWMCIVEVKND